jgi:NAD(P)H-dependent FMN reductase
MKKIFVINGSASTNSSNLMLIDNFINLTKEDLDFTIFNELKSLPHFDPELSLDNPPQLIIDFRNNIQNADGILICTPEYVFSIPSGLKNAIEWCIATTVFSGKPCGLITASASGLRGHKELQLVMKTAMAKFTPHTTLLIQGIKGKVDKAGQLSDPNTAKQLLRFAKSFTKLVTI